MKCGGINNAIKIYNRAENMDISNTMTVNDFPGLGITDISGWHEIL